MNEFTHKDTDSTEESGPNKSGSFSPKNMVLWHALEMLVEDGVIELVPVKEEK